MAIDRTSQLNVGENEKVEEGGGNRKMPSSSIVHASFSLLLTTHDSLQTLLEKSRNMGNALQNATSGLQRIHSRMPSLQDALAPLRSHKRVTHELGAYIDKAVGPAVAVLKVFNAVHGLERSLLSNSECDIIDYISLVCRLEDAIDFLAENCNVAIQSLQEIVEFLEENCVLEEDNMQKLKSILGSLKEWQVKMERTGLDGGLLAAALDKLELQFKRYLSEMSKPISLPSSAISQQKCEAGRPSPLPVQNVKKLQMMVEKLASNDRANACLELYVEIRSRAAKASLHSLGMDYLQYSNPDLGAKLEWSTLERFIEAWTRHIGVVVTLLFEPEYRLCNHVFEKLEFERWAECFGRLAVRGGMMEFLQFGEVVFRSPIEPPKIFKLLDMFEAMYNLRPNFTKIFGSIGCLEIQQCTRDLLKHIVEGACKIILELQVQAEHQQDLEASLDGSIPRVSGFVVGYIRQLVGDFYGPIVTRVLAIEQSWRNGGMTEDGLLSKAVRRVIQALELNLHEWARSYKEPTLFHLFLMNNYWFLYVSCKVSEFQPFVGDLWLRELQHQAEHHASLYLKEGWGKAAHHLNIEGLIILTQSRAAARNLLKMRLKAFNATYDELYQKHRNWIVPDPGLREKTCLKVVKTIVPAYRTYIQSYGPLMEQDGSLGKYAKYTAQSLEVMLTNLFQGRSERIISGSANITNRHNTVSRPAVVEVT
eukprot:c26734_g1_i1 orf=552-2669(+)